LLPSLLRTFTSLRAVQYLSSLPVSETISQTRSTLESTSQLFCIEIIFSFLPAIPRNRGRRPHIRVVTPVVTSRTDFLRGMDKLFEDTEGQSANIDRLTTRAIEGRVAERPGNI